MILDFHPIGNVFFKQLARSMAQRGLLTQARVAFQHSKDSKLNAILPGSLATTLSRRALPPEVLPYARYHPWREVGRVAAIKFGARSLITHETGRFSVDKVFHAFDRKVARDLPKMDKVRGVYAYEDGALFSFLSAKRCDKRCLYDLPIGYWKAARVLLTEEAEREPEWAMTLHGNSDSPTKTDRKDEEVLAADDIFVASSFTKSTLEQAPKFDANVHVVPYGAPQIPISDEDLARRDNSKLRILYVGSLGQRKGLSYLKQAVEALDVPFELTIIGAKPQQECKPLNELLDQHRYIPSCPHEDVLKEMRQHHVFLFPSLFEGFGLVLLEAMSQGMAVITTAHTAGPDIIDHGKDGFILPIRDAEAITRQLLDLSENLDSVVEIGAAARAKAKGFTWDAYGNGICDIIEQTLRE